MHYADSIRYNCQLLETTVVYTTVLETNRGCAHNSQLLNCTTGGELSVVLDASYVHSSWYNVVMHVLAPITNNIFICTVCMAQTIQLLRMKKQEVKWFDKCIHIFSFASSSSSSSSSSFSSSCSPLRRY